MEEVFDLAQFAKPNGDEGYRLTKHMNEHHLKLTEWGLDNILVAKTDVALDIGCGGGNTVKMLLNMASRVCGIDISQVSVDSTIENNRDSYDSGKLEVKVASASKLPYADGTFNVITAVETVYFWEDILVCFNEVFRTLKSGGTFCMIFEAYACPEQHEYNQQLKAKMKGYNVYSPEQLEIYLTSVGFRDVLSIMKPNSTWLCCVATK